MILRRFMQHVREQNWFAVGLDVIVVIVGIFLGLQVQEWYQNEQERVIEQEYLTRLHDEIITIEQLAKENYERDIVQNQLLFEATNYFSDTLPDVVLNETHCDAIYRSHNYVVPALMLPTLSEIINSGQLTLIQDRLLKKLLSDYYMSQDELSRVVANASITAQAVGAEFPDLIEQFNATELPGYNIVPRKHECDYVAMNDNRAFNNLLVVNARRQFALLGISEKRIASLSDLHLRLDELLGEQHTEEVALSIEAP